MKSFTNHLCNTAYLLILGCLVSVSFAFSLKTHHPFDPIKEVFFHFFVLLAGFLIAVRAILTHTLPINKDFLHILVFSYLCYNTLSFVFSPYPDRGYFINLVLLLFFFFFVAASVNSETKYTYLLYVIAGISSTTAIYAVFQFFGIDYHPLVRAFGARGLGTRAFSFFGNPNFLAAFLLMSLPLLLSGFFTKQRTVKVLFAISIVLAFAGLLLTNTRAAYLGSTISIILFFVITYGKAPRKRYLWAVSTTIILVVAGFFFIATLTPEVLEPRISWWRNTLEIVQDYPLFGTGVGSFNVYYPAYRERSTEIQSRFNTGHETRLKHPHNEFLEILSDLGFCGFLLFSGIIVAFFYNYYSNWNPRKKYLLAGNCCAVMGVLIHGLFSVNLRFLFVEMFFWLHLALQSTLLFEPPGEERATFSAGRILACIPILPLLAMFFFRHSMKEYSAEYYLKEGLTAFNAEDFREAETHLQQAVKENPQHKSSLYFLGMSQLQLEKFALSKQTLRELIKLDPNYLQSHYWLASNYFKTQNFEEAKQEFQESLRVNDAYAPSYYALGLIFLRENDIEQALTNFERARHWSDSTMGDIKREAGALIEELQQPQRQN